MKNIFLKLILLFIVTCTFSCNDDFLDEEIYGKVDDGLLWKNKSDIQQAINSCVSNLDQKFGYHTMHFLIMEDAATDYWVGGSATANEYSTFSQWRTNYPTTFNWAVWPGIWKSIYYSNLVLERMDRVPNLTDDEKKRFEGQARFFRALNYYFAQNKFGGVPIITSITDGRTSIPQNTREEVRLLIEADLIRAAAILPGKTAAKTEGMFSRPSKQAALGLLARLYINWESRADRWQKTKETCDLVIADPAGAGLEAPYSKIFALDNENNKEILFALEHNTVSVTTGNFILNNYFASPADINVITAFRGWNGNWKITRAFYDKFNVNDARKNQMYTSYTNKNGVVTTSFPGTVPWVKKYPLEQINFTNPFGGNDQPLIRYADIILMKAEAENHLGNLEVAIDLVNQIRVRAGLTNLDSASFTTKEQLNDEIYDERRREFFYEGLGRTDMIRFKLSTNTTHDNEFLKWVQRKIYLNQNNNNATNFIPSPQTEAEIKYLIYPFDGIALTKNQGLKQNPGYLN